MSLIALIAVRAKILYSLLRKTLCDFCHARGGNIAITFALASLPIMTGVGAAIDYSRANFVKAKMQAAIDSTALMLTNEAVNDNPSQLQANASKYFLAMFNVPGVPDPTITVTYSSDVGTTIVVKGSTSVPTTILEVLGIHAINIVDTSTVKWGSSKLEVALVLDNTGSMQQSGKMAALQTAAKNFLTQLNSAAANNGDVYVSIIPFAKDVNLDLATTSPWIDWTDWDANNGTCSGAGGGGFGGFGGFGSSNGSTGASQSTCGGTWNPKNHNTWNGCVSDRGRSTGPDPASYDTNSVTPTTSIAATFFSVEQYDSCPQAVMGLSYNWPAMNSLINNMSPAGNTNQAIGLALGWMSLVGGGPFTVPAVSSGYTYQKIIILLTDGLNTQDRWYSVASQIDARQTMTCDNIKAAGITLYTVQISTDATPLSPLLKNCASDATKFFYLTSASQLVTTFSQIGNNLTNLRIAK